MTNLTESEIERLRDVLVEHGSVYGSSNCRICGVTRCNIWVAAYDSLAAANASMTPAKLLTGPTPRSRG